jgi:hypothetical protein
MASQVSWRCISLPNPVAATDKVLISLEMEKPLLLLHKGFCVSVTRCGRIAVW